MGTIYTKTGDSGYTKLGDGTPIHKSSERVEAYGTIDELSSFLGLAVSILPSSFLVENIEWVQAKLLTIGAVLADPKGKLVNPAALEPSDLGRLEAAIDEIASQLSPLTNFIIPGGSSGAAHLHCARAICRRAERRVAAVAKKESLAENLILPFLNRLSDYLFTAARWANQQAGLEDRLETLK